MGNRNRSIKIIFVIILVINIILVDVSTNFAQIDINKINISTAIEETGKVMYKNTPDPGVGTLSGEWTILSLARSGHKVPKSYYDKYYENVVKKLKECNGNLHKIKYTEYSRVILGLTSIGKDVTNVGGYNLLEKLADFNKVIKQGINGPIFALIALDTNNYEIPIVKNVEVQTTRDMLIDYILNKEIKKGTNEAGGWALTGDIPDPDITAMALQSLAKYKGEERVKPYIDRALNVLSNLQLETGEYTSWGTTNSESIAQVIVALTALDIDPAKDNRFIKQGDQWLISAIMGFYIEGGGFRHVKDKEIDAMATDQGMYAIAAYDRFVKDKKRLYDMTDAKETLNTGEISNPTDENEKDDEKKDEDYNTNKNETSTDKNSSSLTNTNKNENYNKKNNNTTSTNKQQKSNINKINNSSKSNAKQKKEVNNSKPVIAKVLYTGEKNSLIKNDKQVVSIQFNEDIAVPKVEFNNETIIYYSNELSNESNVSTYIGIFNKKITLEELNDINKYMFNKSTTSEFITFGDINGDNIVNAQDFMNITEVILGNRDTQDDKEIISMNVNGDSKIDNADIIEIVDRYINEKQCSIVNKFKN